MAESATGRPAARRRNARGEGSRLREQLIEATVALLDAEGDAARLSVRAIAKAAGVSPTALYLHFPDRDALVSAAVDRGFEAFNAALLEAADAHTEPIARIRAMGVAYLRFSERQPELYTVIFSARRPLVSRSFGDEDGVERDQALDELMANVAAASPRAGAGEASAVALALWAALHGYAELRSRAAPGGWPDSEAFVDLIGRAHLG
jgi:AcrR family transcriptional regulator